MREATQIVWSASSESLLQWDDAFHELMLNDRLRMTTYRKAIFEAVRPGDLVLDLGTGTGILSQWALEAGAARVLGVDLNTAILARAVERMQAAGLGERFEPISALSYELQLPARVDVLISEIIGNVGDNEDFQPILSDAIARLLKPGGRVLPRAVRSYLAPVGARVAHEKLRAGEIAALYRLEPGRSVFDVYYDCVLPSALCLSEPQLLCNYEDRWQQPATYRRELCFAIARADLLTGFKGHFVAELTPNTVLDISGGGDDGTQASDSWKHAYFPIAHPIEVQTGDLLALSFARSYRDRERRFAQVYAWSGTVTRAGEVIACFDQRMDAASSDAAGEDLAGTPAFG